MIAWLIDIALYAAIGTANLVNARHHTWCLVVGVALIAIAVVTLERGPK